MTAVVTLSLYGMTPLWTVITVMKFVCATASPLIQRIWNLSAERLLSPGYVPINSEEETLPKRLASSLLVCSTRMKNWLPEFAINQHTLDISTMDEEDADKACRHWTAQRIAEDNNVSAATVQKYAIFTRALEEIGKKEPKLVPKILSGQYKIAHKHVLEMAELNPQDLRRINRKIDRNPAEFMHYKATRPVVQGNKTVYSEGDISTGPSVKDMPEYDPDAEISSLTLTIPSWKSSIERAKNTADLTIVSPQAKGDLAQALRELRNTIADMLSEVEDI